jgi:hypothetical protein
VKIAQPQQQMRNLNYHNAATPAARRPKAASNSPWGGPSFYVICPAAQQPFFAPKKQRSFSTLIPKDLPATDFFTDSCEKVRLSLPFTAAPPS